MAQLSADSFAVGGELIGVEEALLLVTARIPPIAETEQVSLTAADERVLVKRVVAPINLPVFDNSAVDGYAVCYADLNSDTSTRLPVTGRVAAGNIPEQRGGAGTAMGIFTGAPMPAGTETVSKQ
jgi:molybdopterin molybdotransferase